MVVLQMLLMAGALGGGDSQAVLLNFTQANCPPCRAMEPVLAELAASGLAVQSIAVDQHPEVASRFKVTGTPTFVMLVNERESGRIVGKVSAEKLRSLFPDQVPVGEVRGQSPDNIGSHLGQHVPDLVQQPRVASPQAMPTYGDSYIATSAPGPVAAQPASAGSQQQHPHTRATAATVRLKVEDEAGYSIGSGTIIDTHGNEAVLVTCGHIFRKSQGAGRIMVDLFYPQPQTVEGKLLDYSLERDIAIVSIAPGEGVIAAPIATSATTVAKQDTAFSLGCDKGQDPSLRQTKITSLNRYQGPANIETTGAPVDGRSGGGLFSREGQLIGVCNAADPQDDEGIYAAMETIHWQLEKVGLAALGQRESAAPPAPLVATPQFESPISKQTLPAVATSDEMEVICIIRSKTNPTAKKQVIVIERATPDLLNRLAENASDPTAAADLALNDQRRSSARVDLGGPQVRGQSRR